MYDTIWICYTNIQIYKLFTIRWARLKPWHNLLVIKFRFWCFLYLPDWEDIFMMKASYNFIAINLNISSMIYNFRCLSKQSTKNQLLCHRPTACIDKSCTTRRTKRQTKTKKYIAKPPHSQKISINLFSICHKC